MSPQFTTKVIDMANVFISFSFLRYNFSIVSFFSLDIIQVNSKSDRIFDAVSKLKNDERQEKQTE